MSPLTTVSRIIQFLSQCHSPERKPASHGPVAMAGGPAAVSLRSVRLGGPAVGQGSTGPMGKGLQETLALQWLPFLMTQNPQILWLKIAKQLVQARSVHL